jgi:hypothetical protein
MGKRAKKKLGLDGGILLEWVVGIMIWHILQGIGMPVTLATQEAEIRRITVRGQPQANNLRDPILKTLNTRKSWQNGSKYRP